MRIKRIIIFLLAIALGIPSVNAKEVEAKYQYLPDNSIYSKKIISKETMIELDIFNITLTDQKENNQNSNIKIIPVTDNNQLIWINENTKNNEIVKAYYFIFEDNNNNQINIDNLKVRLNDNKNKYIIYTIDSEGKIIDQSTQSKQEIKISNNSYFVITENSAIKKLKYQSNVGGVIILDGQIINETGEYTFYSNKIIIRIDSGYALKSATLNNYDALNNINNGFLDVANLKELNLNLEFTKTTEQVSNNSYNFSGQVIYNGKPLANAHIELHSTTLTTTTNKLGNFYLQNIFLGKHSITISYNEKVIGYSEFAINEKDDKNLELVYKDNERIITNSNEVNLTLYINNDYDVTIKNKKELPDNIEQNGTNKQVYLIIVSIMLILLLIIYLLYKKYKNKQK